MSTKKYVRKTRYPYRLYVPENLDIEEVLYHYPPSFNYHIDFFIYILHLIISIPLRLKDYDIEKQKGFTPFDKKILSRRIHNYKQFIEYLKKYNIVQEGTSYKPGYYSKGLKFTQKYRTRVKATYITKNTLIKSITESHVYRDINAEGKLWFLKQWFNQKLTIDIQKAKIFLELDMKMNREKLEAKRAKFRIKKAQISIDDIVTMGYNMKYIVADKIYEGNSHHTTVDKTSGRFHSPLTQLKKGLRKYVRYDGEKLCAVDIVNSQPLLALIVLDFDLFMKNEIYKIIAFYNENHKELMNMDKLSIFTNPSSTMLVNLLKKCSGQKDVQFFKKAVIEGKFYEFFGELLLNKNLLPAEIRNNSDEIRGFAKTAIFTAFFSRIKDAKWNEHIKAFRKCFPTVARIFDLIKHGKDNHPALACLLQRFESNLVLHEACNEINNTHPDIPLFTVHDSIVTTKRNVPFVEEIFRKHISLKLGINPELKIEPW